MKYVFVNYDPLYEKVICVHEKSDSECSECRRVMKENRNSHQLEVFKRLIKS